MSHLMKQILTGINYLHNEIGIIHRDLKLNNLLLKYHSDFDLKNVNEAEIKIQYNLSEMIHYKCSEINFFLINLLSFS